MAGQIRAVYATLRETLNRFGASFADVVREAIYVTDMDSFIAANEARKETYANLDLPAATAVEVKRLAFPQNLIEIEITAVISE